VATSSSSANSVGATVALLPSGASDVLYYHFDEVSWSSGKPAVVDATGNGYDATAANGANTANATPAIGGSPGTCRYGTFDGSKQYVQVPSSVPRLSGAFTIATWIRTTDPGSSQKDQRIWVDDDSSDGYALSLGDGGYGRVRFFVRRPSQVIIDTDAVVKAGTWYFVAVTRDTAGTTTVYVYSSTGSLLTSASASIPGFSAGTGRVAIGGELDSAPDGEGVARWRFQGNIDELRLYSRALDSKEVQALTGVTQPCPNATIDHFVVSHDRYGIHCLDETITVTAVDASGNPFSGFSGDVTLTTNTSRGSWYLASGKGVLTDATLDDGLANYAWPSGDSAATFTLRYRDGSPAVDVDVYQVGNTSIRDDETEGTLVFSPSGFTFTSAVLSNPPPATIPAFTSPQIAGSTVGVYLTAYGQTPNDATCGVIESYTGTKALKFWSGYVNPATGTRQATVDGVAVVTAEASAAARNVTFTNGQASVTLKYKDAGSITLSMKDDTTGNPGLATGIRGSTGTVVMRPADFLLTAIKRTSDNFANPGATTATGTVFIAAGRPFSATVTAVDAEGTATPNFGHESPAESLKLEPRIYLPAGGVASTIAQPVGFGTFSNGQATGTDFSWPEVGIMQIAARIKDGSYLAASDVVGSNSSAVGRFIPDNFGASLNTPLFATGCVAGAYTYVGQPLTYSVAPVLTATARAYGGATTRNYTGAFMRLTNGSLTGRNYTTTTGTLDTSGLPATSGDPAIVDAGAGTVTLTFSAGTGLKFSRSSVLAPFAATLTLGINVIDLDSVAAANPVVFGSGTGIGFSAGATQRYGRLTLRNAVGSELLDLPVRLRTEYYLDAAQGFVPNLQDSCTTGVTVAFTKYTGRLAAGETCVRDSGSPGASGLGCAAPAASGARFRSVASGGDFNLILATPGKGNDGSVSLRATPPTWLEFDFDTSTAGFEQPTGIASFGRFPGSAAQIYQGSIY
jgi:MSHA biogenesis protein MshQ